LLAIVFYFFFAKSSAADSTQVDKDSKSMNKEAQDAENLNILK